MKSKSDKLVQKKLTIFIFSNRLDAFVQSHKNQSPLPYNLSNNIKNQGTIKSFFRGLKKPLICPLSRINSHALSLPEPLSLNFYGFKSGSSSVFFLLQNEF